MPKTDSVFTKIIKGELPATIHYEDDDFIVINNIDPKAPVHVLIISKLQYESLEAVDLTNEKFHASALKLCRKMAKELGIADNYKIHLNVGRGVQMVHHLHIHLLGGWKKPKDSNEFI